MTQLIFISTFLIGMILGLICFLTLIPALPVLPKVAELKEKTAMGWPSLLLILFKWPAIWVVILGSVSCSTVLINRDLRFCFFAGLFVALIYFCIELAGRDFEEEGTQIMQNLLNSIESECSLPVSAEQNPEEKYPHYSTPQMLTSEWRKSDDDLENLDDMPWQCAHCLRKAPFSEAEISFLGSEKRYVVNCPECKQSSIIRVLGNVFTGYQIATEARIAKDESSDKIKEEETTSNKDNTIQTNSRI